MRLHEILNESVTFGVAKLEVRDDGKKYYSNPFQKLVDRDCWECDGTGEQPRNPGVACVHCDGSGKEEEWVSDAPELNVANGNASAIVDMLGLDNSDYTGIIYNKDLPNIRRKLIKLKNTDTSMHTQEPSHTQGKVRVSHDDELGIPRITRGPHMYDAGRSQGQVDRYIDSLLAIIDFAQKNDLDVTWA